MSKEVESDDNRGTLGIKIICCGGEALKTINQFAKAKGHGVNKS